MSYATPVRRPSHAPSSTPDVASPPPSFSRRVSAVSSAAPPPPSPSLAGSERKRRTRLRDYYALATPREGHHQLDLDSPDSFDPHSYFTTLSSTASLPDLLKREIQLLNEIRELDGERQSLVYNHHHELIDASDTIRKMKSRAEALDTSLDALKTSFESISQLSASLAPPRPLALDNAAPGPAPAPAPAVVVASPGSPPQTPTAQTGRLDPLPESPSSPSPSPGGAPNPNPTSPSPSSTRRARSASSATTRAAEPPSAAPPPRPAFNPLTHLSALLSLPILLRALLLHGQAQGQGGDHAPSQAQAHALWGAWEPALRSWEDGGVEGAREVGSECREVLRLGAGGGAAAAVSAGGAGRRWSVSAGVKSSREL